LAASKVEQRGASPRRDNTASRIKQLDEEVAEVALGDLLDQRRPHRADAARNFDAIITAARAGFTDDGTEASLEDVARRAGVGPGTLYRNFPTREDLIEAVYVAEVDSL
jgi:AcrR family transcriptional regulator